MPLTLPLTSSLLSFFCHAHPISRVCEGFSCWVELFSTILGLRNPAPDLTPAVSGSSQPLHGHVSQPQNLCHRYYDTSNVGDVPCVNPGKALLAGAGCPFPDGVWSSLLPDIIILNRRNGTFYIMLNHRCDNCRAVLGHDRSRSGKSHGVEGSYHRLTAGQDRQDRQDGLKI